MDKFERLDFNGPNKEFIKNNLIFLLDNSPKDQNSVQSVQDFKYSNNRYLRFCYRVFCKNDPVKVEQFQNRIITRLDKTPKIKRWLKTRLIGKTKPNSIRVSLEHLLSLSVNDFITQTYLSMLGRMPESEGFNAWRNAICSSMPKEAMIYSISKTSEFGGRFAIENTKKYRAIYFSYKIKNLLKKTPILGYIVRIVLMPKRLEQ